MSGKPVDEGTSTSIEDESTIVAPLLPLAGKDGGGAMTTTYEQANLIVAVAPPPVLAVLLGQQRQLAGSALLSQSYLPAAEQQWFIQQQQVLRQQQIQIGTFSVLLFQVCALLQSQMVVGGSTAVLSSERQLDYAVLERGRSVEELSQMTPPLHFL